MRNIYIGLVVLFSLPPKLMIGQSCIVHFTTIIKSGQSDTFYFPIIRIHESINKDDYLESDVLNTSKKGDTLITTMRYKINKPTCAIIGDGFGHEIVISPNDTVSIFCEKYPRNYRFTKDSIHSPWIFKMSYGGKSKSEFEIFDSLVYVGGLVHHDMLGFNQDKDKINDFFKKSTIQYNARIDYVNEYNKRHHLSAIAVKYVLSEVKYRYLTKLITPFIDPYYYVGNLNQISKPYLDSLSLFNKNEYGLFENTLFYSYYLQMFVNLFDGHFNKDSVLINNQSYNLLNAYSGIKNSNIKNYFASNLLKQLIKQRMTISSKVLNQFKKVCTNQEYREFIVGLYKKEPPKIAIKYSEALASKIDSNSIAFNLEDILGLKPVLIDCWASWCVPCINQMQYTKALEEEYKNKVEFVYFSFDKRREDWKAMSNKLKIEKNNYILAANFKSNFAAYFNITSIPRYIIIGKNKEVIMANVPKPSRKESIRKILDGIIPGTLNEKK